MHWLAADVVVEVADAVVVDVAAVFLAAAVAVFLAVEAAGIVGVAEDIAVAIEAAALVARLPCRVHPVGHRRSIGPAAVTQALGQVTVICQHRAVGQTQA